MFCNAHYAVVEFMESTNVPDATHRSQTNNRLYKMYAGNLCVWQDAYGWIVLTGVHADLEKQDLIPIGQPVIRYMGSSIDETEIKYYESIETKRLYVVKDGEVQLYMHGRMIGSSFEEFEMDDKTLFKRKTLAD